MSAPIITVNYYRMAYTVALAVIALVLYGPGAFLLVSLASIYWENP